MITFSISKLTVEEKKELIRELLKSLPEPIRKEEIARADRVLRKIPAIIIEAPDGTTVRCSTVIQAQSAIENLSGKQPDISNIYKALDGQLKTIYGLKLKKYYEE